jgi:hypothetical protein
MNRLALLTRQNPRSSVAIQSSETQNPRPNLRKNPRPNPAEFVTRAPEKGETRWFNQRPDDL